VTNNAKLQPPRRCDGPAMLIAGLGEYHTFQDLSGLPAQWQRFRTLHVPKRIGSVAYGVCYNTDDNGFDYIAGVEVSDFDSVPPDFARAKLNPQHYAVFSHPGHVSTVHETFMAIFRDWFPNANEQPAAAPVFERFDERFNGQTGLGGFEIWVPLKA
jgi:AraC family transcriptional regulator